MLRQQSSTINSPTSVNCNSLELSRFNNTDPAIKRNLFSNQRQDIIPSFGSVLRHIFIILLKVKNSQFLEFKIKYSARQMRYKTYYGIK